MPILVEQNVAQKLPAFNTLVRYLFAAQPVSWTAQDGKAKWVSKCGKLREPLLCDCSSFRDEFLSIAEGNIESLIGFLKKSGVWREHVREVPFEDFWRDQQNVRALLTRKASKELKNEADQEMQFALMESMGIRSIHFEYEGPPVLELMFSGMRNAIFISVWLDLSRNASFRYCLRPDCPKHKPSQTPFEVKRTDQVYCGQYCAHVESQRRNRAERKTKKHRKFKRGKK